MYIHDFIFIATNTTEKELARPPFIQTYLYIINIVSLQMKLLLLQLTTLHPIPVGQPYTAHHPVLLVRATNIAKQSNNEIKYQVVNIIIAEKK